MNTYDNESARLGSVRTLVRYVDEGRAVIDATFTIIDSHELENEPVEIHLLLTGPKGRLFTCQSPVELVNGEGMLRFEIKDPRRWWPAGMGDQDLYEVCVTLLVGDQSVDSRKSTLGMTSVRRPEQMDDGSLLVNGHAYEIHDVVTIKRDDEQSVLPVSGDSLLLIHDHFAPDVLYDAADRAGILLVQSVPLSPQAKTRVNVRREVDRLAAHPSLAGWMVDRAGRFSDRIVDRIHSLDPTRNIFRDLPRAG